MKAKQKNKFSLVCASTLLCLLPALSYSQSGQNDAAFNTLNDSVWGGPRGTNAQVTASLIQPDGKIIIAGDFTSYNGKEVYGIIRLNANGTVDPGFNSGAGAGGTILTISMQRDRKILISGEVRSYNMVRTNYIARLNSNGSLDSTFKMGPDAGANGIISHAVIQPDGKILIAGTFTQYNGIKCRNMIRLNTHGEIDTTFNLPEKIMVDNNEILLFDPGRIALQKDGNIVVGFNKRGFTAAASKAIVRFKPNGDVDYSFDCKLEQGSNRKFWGMAIQSDGKIVVAGAYDYFSSDPEIGSGFIQRFNKDGSVDTTFHFKDSYVPLLHSAVLQRDGKIIISGRSFNNFNGLRFGNYIVRLNTNGTFDSTFYFNNREAEKDFMANWTVSVQTDGKIIMGGKFFNTQSNIIRLNADGSRDISFNKTAGANGTVKNITLQQNGKIIIAGDFSSYNLTACNTLARLRADGSLDRSFNPGKGANARILCTAVQPDGKIIIAGDFTQFNGSPANHIARLNVNGSIDHTYRTGSGATGPVSSIVLQADGALLIGGNFISYNGTTLLNSFARLNKNGTLDMVFNNQVKDLPFTYIRVIQLQQKDGKILIGTGLGLYRLNKDGSIDPTFIRIISSQFLNAIAVQEDGKMVVAGGLQDDKIGAHYGFILRLNENGSVDSAFVSSTPMSCIRTVTVLKNNKILVGHERGVYRLNADGTKDLNALADGVGANDQVWCSVLTEDGKAIIGGSFTTYNGVPRNGLAKLEQVPLAGERLDFTETRDPSLDEQEKISIRVYPNPATCNVTVDNLTPGSTLWIYNSLGGVVDQQIVHNEKISISTSNYVNGLYFIANENKDKTSQVKFIINKE